MRHSVSTAKRAYDHLASRFFFGSMHIGAWHTKGVETSMWPAAARRGGNAFNVWCIGTMLLLQCFFYSIVIFCTGCRMNNLTYCCITICRRCFGVDSPHSLPSDRRYFPAKRGIILVSHRLNHTIFCLVSMVQSSTVYKYLIYHTYDTVHGV